MRAPAHADRDGGACYRLDEMRASPGRAGAGLLRRLVQWMDQRLVVKLTLPTVGLTIVLTLLVAWILAASFARTHERHAAERTDRLAGTLVRAFESDARAGHDNARSWVDLLCGATLESIFLTDHAGRVTVACDRRLLATTITPGAPALITGDERRRRTLVPVSGGDGCAGCHPAGAIPGFVGIDVPLDKEDEEVRDLQQLLLGGGILLAGLLSGVIVLVGLVLVFRPVRHLGATVEALRAGDFSARADVGRGDELGELARRVNEMAASLEEAKVELERTHRAELAQSEKLAALGQLVSSIAHEIKNPLSGIIGALRVLEKEATPDAPEKAILAKVLAQVERLSSTACELLDFARPLKPVVTDVALPEVLDRTIFFVERQASAAGIEVRRCYAQDLPLVRADPELMKQVFLNVLLNAVQAMAHGGGLEIDVREAEAGDWVDVTIADQGAGIPREQLPRIFDPFYTTKTQGTGLGLYVARQLIETQGGRVSVESRLGRGTAFTIRLPVATAAACGGDVVAPG
jgi:signal transduction histidine kinase